MWQGGGGSSETGIGNLGSDLDSEAWLLGLLESGDVPGLHPTPSGILWVGTTLTTILNTTC